MRDQVDVAPQPRPAPLSLQGAALPVPVSHARQCGPGSLLSISSGSIAGDLRGIALDEKRRTATYELLVANETISPIATFAYIVGSAPGAMISWNTITVPAFSAIALTLDIPLPALGKEQRVVVELHADDAHLTLDAKPPQSKKRGKSVSLTNVTLMATVVAATALYSVLSPRVTVLEAPSSVIAGKPFMVAYAIAGSANGNYIIETPDGFQVRRGTLDLSHNTITLDLPEFPISRGYDMRVSAEGKLGTQTRVAHITAIPPAFTPPPQLAPVLPLAQNQAGTLPVIALASDTVSSGGQIALTYPITAGSGSATLYDQNNVPHGTTLLDKNGHASLLAPVVSADQPLRVVVRVQSGNSTLESSATLTIKAQPASTPPAEISALSQEEPGVPFALPVQAVKSGGIIRIGILRHEDALKVGISTTDGAVLSQVDVPLSQGEVLLRAPTVSTNGSYLIVGTYRQGVGQETVIRRITVTR
jgi:hypothetical protein